MHVVVLGAGVVGLTTAYFLTRDGHRVTVVDRNDGVALETSFANGAQLSYSYVAPLAGPGVLPKIPPWLLRRDSPLRFYPAFDPNQWRWLLEFVLACNRTQSDLTTRRLLALSFYSRRLMHAFIASEQIEFGHATNGKLVVFSDGDGFESARRLVDYQRSLGEAILGAVGAVRASHFALRLEVCEEGEAQLPAGSEGGVTPDPIDGHPQHLRPEGRKFTEDFIVECHLVATNRAPVGGVEGQDGRPPAQFSQRDASVRSTRQREIRRRFARSHQPSHVIVARHVSLLGQRLTGTPSWFSAHALRALARETQLQSENGDVASG